MHGNRHSGLARLIGDLEAEIIERKRKLAALRRQLPEVKIRDYVFTARDGSSVSLSDLFGDHHELVVIHNMGEKCPYCTLWADGFNGIVPHLESRAAFIVTSPDDPKTQDALARSRKWTFDMYSVKDSPFAADMGYQNDTGGYLPGVSTFRKAADGSIYRTASASFGPGDDFCSIWHLFDLLSAGPDGWEPKYQYE